MLFNSYEFIFLFLPITFYVFFATARLGHEIAITWLVGASLFFYGWWNPVYLILIVLSMIINFVFGELLRKTFKYNQTYMAKFYLTIGIILNLSVLGYFKYAKFFIDNLNALMSANIQTEDIILPLAISFFTFQQIAYLSDAYNGIIKEYKFSHYALFVTFFPQLIAGPIVHHKEMLPQFMRQNALKPQIGNVAVGLTIFFFGLFKKSVLADGVSNYSSLVFDSAINGGPISFFIAWGGALAYTMQLYFDFSGYSDMAIGGARIFGIRLPLNFHSPYKATSIIEFWRRWHITLSRFLRDYLYIPLGGNRKGILRRYINLMTTMLLGGLWHGAGWTFVIWGGLHGFYLVVNHGWHWILHNLGRSDTPISRVGKLMAWLSTFMAVVVGWVFFRAADLHSAILILKGMSGINGVALPNAIIARLGRTGVFLENLGVRTYLGGGANFVYTYLWVGSLLAAVLFMPNTQQIMSRAEPALKSYQSERKYEISFGKYLSSLFVWQPSMGWSVIVGLVSALGILALTSISEFLYFQF